MVGKGTWRSPRVQGRARLGCPAPLTRDRDTQRCLILAYGDIFQPQVAGGTLLPSPCHSQRCLKKQDTRAPCVLFFH